VAMVNLDLCAKVLAGEKLDLSGANQATEQYRNLKQVVQLIHADGDFDDPGIRCILGNAWLEAGWPRQAWRELDHAVTLAPDAMAPQLAMAQIDAHFRLDDKVFATIQRLRPLVTNSPAGQTLELNLDMLEARTWMSQTNRARANEILSTALLAHPNEPMFTEAVLKAYLAFGEPNGALDVLATELAKDPDNIAALNNQAAILIEQNHPAAAIGLLDHALTLTNLPAIRLNRAIANMQVTNLAAAEKDYELLADTAADQFSVHYGLAQIALSRKNTNAAVRELGCCLTNTPSDGVRAREVRARLDVLGR